MLIALDRSSGTPVFRQICEQVRFQVAAGVLPPGSEIPSTRDLAAELGINPMTISKAYALLEQQGVLERRPGLSLVVRRQSDSSRLESRREELTRLLQPAAVAARQLGIAEEEAVEIYRAALRAPGEER
ncbi:MAG TPA: GntR family transcriptional regulator [Phycisphaerales bacterium]|nr:GntR family transcriptional regulator [Phycisphaerales bacterium]